MYATNCHPEKHNKIKYFIKERLKIFIKTLFYCNTIFDFSCSLFNIFILSTMLDIIFIVIGVIIIINTANIIVCTKLSLYIINLSPNNITIEKNNIVINVNSIFL